MYKIIIGLFILILGYMLFMVINLPFMIVNNIPQQIPYNSNFTSEECENWCSEMKFRGQEYVICLTGCNMKRR